MTQTAIIYARFSTLEQGKGSSLDRQLRLGRKFVSDREWALEREIADLGRSAFHGKNRTEGSELHSFEAEAREGRHEGKILVVENLDRLSRQGIKAAAQLIWALNAQGVDVATYHDGHVYKAKSDSDLLDILYIATKAQRAFEESETKSNRGKDTWQDRYKNIAENKKGTRSGRPPQWLDWDGERYQPNPHRAALINEMFDCYLSGMGTYKLVQMLNERNEPAWTNTNKGGWYLAYVHGILKNRALLGEYVKLDGEVVSTSYYPRIVTIEKFTEVNAILSGRAKTGGRDFRRFHNLLSGLPKCAVCEGTAAYENKGDNSFTKHVAKNGEIRLYPRKLYERLRCDNNRRRKGCQNNSLYDYKIVEEAVLDQLLSLTVESDARSTLTQIIDEKIAINARELEVANQGAENVADAITSGEASRTLSKRLAHLETEIDRLEAERKTLVREREAEASKPTVTDDAKLIATLREEINSTDEDTRLAARTKVNSALRRMVEGVFVGDDDTFTVLADIAVWQFDKTGKLIGGQAL